MRCFTKKLGGKYFEEEKDNNNLWNKTRSDKDGSISKGIREKRRDRI